MIHVDDKEIYVSTIFLYNLSQQYFLPFKSEQFITLSKWMQQCELKSHRLLVDII